MKQGIPTRGSAGKLTQKHIDTLKHKGHWHTSMIHRIATDEMYTGKLIQNRYYTDKRTGKKEEHPESEWIIGTCPTIISDDLFERVQQQIKLNARQSRRKTKPGREYMLK